MSQGLTRQFILLCLHVHQHRMSTATILINNNNKGTINNINKGTILIQY